MLQLQPQPKRGKSKRRTAKNLSSTELEQPVLYWVSWRSELFQVCPLSNDLATGLLLCSMLRSHIIAYPQNSFEISNEEEFTASHGSSLNYHWTLRFPVWTLPAEPGFRWVVTLLITTVNATASVTEAAGKENSRMASESPLLVRPLPQLCVLSLLCCAAIQSQPTIPISFWAVSTLATFIYCNSELALIQQK